MTMAVGRRDWSAPIFDRIYTSLEPGSSVRPNAFLVDLVKGKTPGTALDIAMGQGRNSVYLASSGWDVTDSSYASALVDSLRLEGLLVTESSASEKDRSPRPVDIDPDLLRSAYSRLQALRLENRIDTPDWTREPSRIIRMAAIKS